MHSKKIAISLSQVVCALPTWARFESPGSGTQSDPAIFFRQQVFHFLSLPLNVGELGRVHHFSCAWPGWFVLMHDKAAEGSTRM